MSAGWDWNERSEILQFVRNSVERPIENLFAGKLTSTPGERMNYNSVATHVLGRILEIETQTPLHELAEQKLFEPLGIKTSKWETDPQGRTWGGTDKA